MCSFTVSLVTTSKSHSKETYKKNKYKMRAVESSETPVLYKERMAPKG